LSFYTEGANCVSWFISLL